jgi:hypothetical protein
MAISIKATNSDIVQYQLPEHHQDKAQFIKFLQYYYKWMEEANGSTTFLQNLVETTDIDNADEDTLALVVEQIFGIIPRTTFADKRIIAKHLKTFLQAKGSLPSYEFIMTALFGEEMKMEWMSDYVFKASANSFSQVSKICVESGTSDFSLCLGGRVTQITPRASATIESVSDAAINGISYNIIKIDPKTINGTFIIGKEVRALHRSVDSSKTAVEDYYPKVLWVSSTKTLVVKTNEFKNVRYTSLLIKQLGSTFSGVIDKLAATSTANNTLEFILSSYTGSIGSGDFFIIPPILEGKYYTREDYEYGFVSESLVGVNMTNAGSLATSGGEFNVVGGSGDGARGYISDLGRGSVDSVFVLAKGQGYSVGDQVSVSDHESGGYGFSAEVSAIDGYGAEIVPVMELDDVQIISGGENYQAGESFTLLHPSLVNCTFSVSTVNQTTLRLENVRIGSMGAGYQYAKVALSNNGGAPIAGLAADVILNNGDKIVANTTYALLDTSKMYPDPPLGAIIDIQFTAKPTGLSAVGTHSIKINGYGASATATLSSGVVTGTSALVGGWNYVDPIVMVAGPGQGAVLSLVKNGAGSITSIVVEKGGTGYTTATIVIKERYGSGAVISPVIYTNVSKGTILTKTIVNRGEFYSLPSTFSAVQKNYATPGGNQILNYTTIDPVEPGEGAKFGLTFKVKRLELRNSGKFYKTPSVVEFSGGLGSGFAGNAVLNGATLERIDVVSVGSGYPEDSAITFSGTWSVMPVATVLVSNGKISSIKIINAGSGLTSNLSFTIASPSSTTATATATISGNGQIRSASVQSGGSDYFTVNEYTPLSLSVTGHPNVLLDPILDDVGSLVGANIISGASSNMTSEDAVVVVSGGIINGGSVKTASVTAKMFQGGCVSVDVATSDSGYKYGTRINAVGTGTGAVLVPVVESGVDKTNLYYAGEVGAYPPNKIYQLTVTDANSISTPAQTFVAAIINVTTNSVGQVSNVTIFSSGRGHVLPVLPAIPDLAVGFDPAIIYLYATRPVVGVVVSAGGTNYEYADLSVVGDGSRAKISATLDKLGSVDAVTFGASGRKYTSVPKVSVVDQSEFGAVSKVSITDYGQLYLKLPLVSLPVTVSKFGAKLGLYSKTIGKVIGTEMSSFGYGWDESPSILFPFNAIVSSTAGFKLGELVKPANAKPKLITSNIASIAGNGTTTLVITLKTQTNSAVIDQSVRTSYDLRIKEGDFVTIVAASQVWGGTWKVSSVTKTTVTLILDVVVGVNPALSFTEVRVDSEKDYSHANIVLLDGARNIMGFANATDNQIIITESGDPIISETSAYIGTEESFDFGYGKIVGTSSGAISAILNINRPAGLPVIGSVGKTEKKFQNIIGMLSERRVRLNDNDKYMDHAYVISTGLSLSDYESYLKRTVHPAGYRMLGEVVINESVNLPGLTLPAIDESSGTVILLIFTLTPVSLINEMRKGDNNIRLYETRFDWGETRISDYDSMIGVSSMQIKDFDWSDYGDTSKYRPIFMEAYITKKADVYATYSKDNGVLTITSDSDVRFTDQVELQAYEPMNLNSNAVTFSRSSIGTYYDSTGVMRVTPVNLLTYSEQFDNGAWTKNDLTVTANSPMVKAPNEAYVADKLVESATTAWHYLGRAGVAITTISYGMSIYAKAGERTVLQIVPNGNAFPTSYANFDLLNGTVSASSGVDSASIVSIGDGWYRCIVTDTATTATSGSPFSITMQNSPTAARVATYAGDGVSGLYIWGAQFETGPVVTPYIKTEAASTGLPRFDYNPNTFASLGLFIEEPRTNLLLNSEDFNTTWTSSNTLIGANIIAAPDGTMTADKIIPTATTPDSPYFTKSQVVTTASLTFTASIFFKAGEYGYAGLRLDDNGSANTLTATYNISAGTIFDAATSSGTVTTPSATITAVGNGWYRCTLTGTWAAMTTLRIFVRVPDDTGNLAFTGDGTSGIYAWGAQVEAAAFATSYIPSLNAFTSRAAAGSYYDSTGVLCSAATNTIRYTYNPSNLGLAPKMLLELAATNLVTYSAITNANWIDNTNGTLDDVGVITPDDSTSTRLTATTTLASTQVRALSPTFSLATATQYTYSTYVKKGNVRYVFITTTGSAYTGTDPVAFFDLDTGLVSTLGATATGSTMISVGGGWYRCTMTTLATNAAASESFMFGHTTTAGSQTHNATDGDYTYFWGAQVESGVSATSYIPTTTIAVLRSADVFTSTTGNRAADLPTMIGANFSDWYNQSEGTFVIEGGSPVGAVNSTRYLVASDGTNNERLICYGSSGVTSISGGITVGGTTGSGADDALSYVGRAYAYKFNDAAWSKDGAAVGVDVTFPLPVGNNQLFIGGNSPYSSTANLNGHISKLSYYPIRLSDADLQTVSAGGLIYQTPNMILDLSAGDMGAEDLHVPLIPKVAAYDTTKSSVTFTRASVATYFNYAGDLKVADVNQPRFDFDPVTGESLGLLVEEGRTNSISNNTMVGVVAGTPGTRPTGWSLGALTGCSINYVGTGVEDGINYVDVQLVGTPSVSSGDLCLFNVYTTVAAVSGQSWAGSAFVSLIGGTTANVSVSNLILTERNSGGTGLASISTSVPLTMGELHTRRIEALRTFNQATTAYATLGLTASVSIGLPVDITLRIGMPQLELGAFVTSVIPTTTAALARSADAAIMTGTNFSDWYNQDEGTFVFEGDIPIVTGDATPRVLYGVGDPAVAFGVGETMYVSRQAGGPNAGVSVLDGGLAQFSAAGFALDASNTFKHCFTYKLDSFAASLNGSTPSVDFVGTLPLPTVLAICGGNSLWTGASSSVNTNGHATRLTYYPKRLTDEQIQTISGGGVVYATPSMSLDFSLGSLFETDVSAPALVSSPTAIDSTGVTFTRDSIGTYFDADGVMQVAVVNEPRFDHDPVTKASLGLMVEESRANLLTYSSDIDNAVWVKTTASITTNAATAPDGTLTADKHINTNVAGPGFAAQSVSFTSGTTYCYSAYVKKVDSVDSVAILLPSAAFTSNVNITFAFSTETVLPATAGAGTITASGFNKLSDGWYRIWFTSPATANASGGVQLHQTVFGDGTSGVYIWGAQLEAGAFPTSYIPTSSVSIPRSADLANMVGTNFSDWYNQIEGTFVAEFKNGKDLLSTVVMAASDGTNDNIISIVGTNSGGTGPYGEAVVATVAQATLTDGVAIADTSYITVLGYKLNDFSFSRGGRVNVTDAVGTLPTLSQLTIGCRNLAGAFLNGTISRLAYYPTRLSDTDIRTLSGGGNVSEVPSMILDFSLGNLSLGLKSFQLPDPNTNIPNGSRGILSYNLSSDNNSDGYTSIRDHSLKLHNLSYSTLSQVMTITVLEPDTDIAAVDFLVGNKIRVEYISGNVGEYLPTGPLKIASVNNTNKTITISIGPSGAYSGKLNILIQDTKRSGYK